MKTTEFPVISMRDCSGGMMSGVDDNFVPDNGSRLSLGFRYSKIGCATTRLGYTKLGGNLVSTCDGLTGFTNASGSINRVVANFNGSDYAYDFSSWTSIGTGNTPGSRVRYASFLDYVFRVGSGSTIKSWDGTVSHSFSSTHLTSAPQGSLIFVYKSKLYVAGNTSFPDRLYFSSVPTVAGAITWDIATQYLDVNPQDGDNITALARTGTQMLIFKNNFIYRWNGTSTDADPVINVGTYSQETLANVNGSVIFFSPTKGIFSTDGGLPVEISRPIKNFVDAIPAANYASMAAYSDGNIFGLICGAVVVDGRTFTNLVLEFDTNTQVWQPHVLGNPFRAFAVAKDSTGLPMLVGGATTNVMTMFTGTTDDGAAIKFERETRRLEFDGLYSTKEVNDVVYYLTGATGSIFEAIPTSTTGIPLEPVRFDASTSAITYSRGKSVRGNSISFKISGTNSGAPAIFRGFEVTCGRSLGLITKN